MTSPVPHLADHARCTGCSACANGCPKGAIVMTADQEGFLYPHATESCVQCGHCAHICPALKQRELRPEPTVFASGQAPPPGVFFLRWPASFWSPAAWFSAQRRTETCTSPILPCKVLRSCRG